LNYSEQTGLLPGILLIMETDADLKYWHRLRGLVNALDEKGVPIQLWRIEPNEIELAQIPPLSSLTPARSNDPRPPGTIAFLAQCSPCGDSVVTQ